MIVYLLRKAKLKGGYFMREIQPGSLGGITFLNTSKIKK